MGSTGEEFSQTHNSVLEDTSQLWTSVIPQKNEYQIISALVNLAPPAVCHSFLHHTATLERPQIAGGKWKRI